MQRMRGFGFMTAKVIGLWTAMAVRSIDRYEGSCEGGGSALMRLRQPE
jgi:hypothetical protein